jgi:hypothetical protein
MFLFQIQSGSGEMAAAGAHVTVEQQTNHRGHEINKTLPADLA